MSMQVYLGFGFSGQAAVSLVTNGRLDLGPAVILYLSPSFTSGGRFPLASTVARAPVVSTVAQQISLEPTADVQAPSKIQFKPADPGHIVPSSIPRPIKVSTPAVIDPNPLIPKIKD